MERKDEHKTRRVFGDSESRYFYKKREYTPLTIEERVSILESKVSRFGFYRMPKRKVDSAELLNFIKLAEEKNIVLVEEDDNLLIFAKTRY